MQVDASAAVRCGSSGGERRASVVESGGRFGGVCARLASEAVKCQAGCCCGDSVLSDSTLHDRFKNENRTCRVDD